MFVRSYSSAGPRLAVMRQSLQTARIARTSRTARTTTGLTTRTTRPTATSLLLAKSTAVRWETTTTTTGDDQSGHIAEKPGEGILFFDNVFPLRLGTILNWRPWRSAADYDDIDVSGLLRRFTSRSKQGAASSSSSSAFDPVTLVKRALPADLHLEVTEIVPRLKDGGVFVKFRFPGGIERDSIEDTIGEALAKKPVRPWFNPLWGGIRAGLVRGVPWLEDLASRVPSDRVRVDFCAPATSIDLDGTVTAGDASGTANLELSQETLYSLFRKYGKIAEITSQPFDSKTLPRYAFVDFVRVRDAVMARSCLHNYVVAGTTRLQLSYERRAKTNAAWEWLTTHPRIVLPILAALLAAFTVAVFDPIREFFIRAHVQKSFAFRDSRLYKWFLRRTASVVAFARDSVDAVTDEMGFGDDDDDDNNDKSDAASGRRALKALLRHRRDLLDSLHTWLLETSQTFIVVQGPRGSGKSELVVEQALKGRRDVLVVDCKPIVEARGESATIKQLANAVGYRPVFSWANSMSSMVDLAVQGTTGVKAGFSETLDEQLAKILLTASTALRDVALDDRHRSDSDAQLNPDAYLEAHPERRPVVVLDNFGQRNNDDALGLVYDKLAEWAAGLVQANVAHVIVLTTDTSSPKALTRALPDRVFRALALGDLSPEVAKKYVLSHLVQKDEVEEEEEAAKKAEQEEQREAGLAPPVDAAAEAQAQLAKQREEQLVQQAQKQLAEGDKADGKEENKTETTDKAKTTTTKNVVSAAVAAVASVAKATTTTTTSTVSGPTNVFAQQTRHDAIKELDECIGTLGGRLTDLESLVRRLKSGQTPKRAVSEIVDQSASEVIKMYLLPGKKTVDVTVSGSAPPAPSSSSNAAATSRGWTTEQAWYLVREIATKESLRYNEVLLSDTFASSPAGLDGVAALDALAAAELITIRSARGRPQTIRAGRPVYQSAFGLLRDDRALAARLDRRSFAERVAVEAQTIRKAEDELVLLGSLPRQPAQTAERVGYLLGKLQTSQKHIAVYEAEMARLTKVLSEEV